MFSKEWKLVALSLFATVALTACPGQKKKQPEATTRFKGLWVNAEAYERLGGMAANGDPRLCYAINNHPRKLGIVRTFTGELMLDAWIIHASGSVYRYSAFENSAAHGYRNPKFLAGQINGTSFNRETRMGSGTYTAYQYGSPFSRGTGILTLDNNMLYVAGGAAYGYGGSSAVSYVRVNGDQLVNMSAVIANCGEILDFGDGWRGRPGPGPHGHGPHVAPVCPPGQQCGPQLGPQVAPPGFQEVPK